MTPRVVAFVNGPLGDHALSLLSGHLVAIVVNQPAPYTDYLLAENATAEVLREFKPTHGVSAGYRAIIPQSIIDLFPHGIANIHTSLLPFGRGAHPNAWAIARNQPAGVTMHLIDAGVDTGPVLHQVPVDVHGSDTAKTLHAVLIHEAKALMTTHLPLWIQSPDAYPPQPQTEPGYTNRASDLETLTLGPEATRIIDILRARTFPPYPGVLYRDPRGRRYRVRVEMTEDQS